MAIIEYSVVERQTTLDQTDSITAHVGDVIKIKYYQDSYYNYYGATAEVSQKGSSPSYPSKPEGDFESYTTVNYPTYHRLSKSVGRTNTTYYRMTVFEAELTCTSTGSCYIYRGVGHHSSNSYTSTYNKLYINIVRDYYSKLVYNANGGSGAPSADSSSTTGTSQPSARSVMIPNTIPTYSGYKFLGWSTTQYSAGTGTASYTTGQYVSVPYSTTDTTTLTLYAVWGKSSTAHVNIGGTWKDAKVYANIGGTWKEVKPYVNIGGTWKETK